ncbi:MAG: UvrD-helicase domain-containing protein [Verrucomicrobiota bacterium]
MDDFRKNLLVLASAGSGKTFCLSDRIIALTAMGVEPEKIVALTFTRKAAGEFADAILKKLAEAASDEKSGRELSDRISAQNVDFVALLEKLVKSLPKLTLGTMDKFFARVVKSFQYELGITGGKFELLEGEVAITAQDELMENLLDGGLDAAFEEEFVEIFRRATAGKESSVVLEDLRKFIANWHSIYGSSRDLKWGPATLSPQEIGDWEKEKMGLIESIRRDWQNVVTTDKRQQAAFEGMMSSFEHHTIGSGSFEKATSLLKNTLEAVSDTEGTIEVSFYKPFTITGVAALHLRKLITLAAHCEFAAALSRTRGIHQVIRSYDGLMERELRSRGRLGFDDVKRLMGAWIKNEDARLRREAIDYRLDATYQHWLLDEFQDTSQDEWNGLEPWIDEALTDQAASVFVVGDKKQAIYAWRGGEVGLFDELTEKYRGEKNDPLALQIDTMAESWRSCPEVLGLVNQVCGDATTMTELFGEAAVSWNSGWEKHVSAKSLSAPEKAGHARVEIVDEEDLKERVVSQLRHLGIGGKELSCGILVSKNDEVREWADALREEGFQVVEEGVREPGRDHPVGVMIWQLLRWLADPSDTFAKQVVVMSPLGEIFMHRYGKDFQVTWDALGARFSEIGFCETIRELLEPVSETWEAFGKRRFDDILQALKELDDQGMVLVKDAAEWIGRMKISQSPGVAAIQVMTIHKSKGLGFDVVILPSVSDDKIPSFTHYNTVKSDDWVSNAPPSWVRKIIPELRQAEETWVNQQTYEAFCKFYVALTRAKRGLYVYIDPPSKSSEPNKPSLGNWLRTSLNMGREIGEVFEMGSDRWHTIIKQRSVEKPPAIPSISAAIPKRARTTPSSGKKVVITGTGNVSARRKGITMHRAFEKVGWLDEDELLEFAPDISDAMTDVLATPEIRDLLSRNGKSIRLYREQRIEAVLNDKWMSGVMDRLHVHADEALVEIIDFKTDRVVNAAELKERYATQMESYRAAVSRIYPKADIRCIMVSTVLKQVVR